MSTENLVSTDAIEKLKEFVDKNATCFFCTDIKEGRFEARPMSTQKIDASGNIWFLSPKASDKNTEIEQDNKVQLLYNLSEHSGFMLIRGVASISYNKEKIEELWEPIVKVWFPAGVDDPSISVIKVVPDDGYYWDTKNGKLVAFAKMAASLVTGKTMDDGVEGTMKM